MLSLAPDSGSVSRKWAQQRRDEIDGELDARDRAVAYKKGNRTLAVATVSRDLQSLQIEAAMEAPLG